jgi:hypothetical protein
VKRAQCTQSGLACCPSTAEDGYRYYMTASPYTILTCTIQVLHHHRQLTLPGGGEEHAHRRMLLRRTQPCRS